MTREYTVLLPLDDNQGKPFPSYLTRQAEAEITQHFGGISVDGTPVAGSWLHDGKLFSDRLIRASVVGDDTPETLAWWRSFKADNERRFDQEELFITSQPTEVLS